MSAQNLNAIRGDSPGIDPRPVTSGRAGAFIDIHSHILPGIDDGARSMDEALQMLQMAVDDGIRVMAATSHASQIDRNRLETSIHQLRMKAQDAGLEIALVSGSEVRLSSQLGERYREGSLLTLNDTSYVLVELPFEREWSPMIHTSLYTLQLAGATPIIAHAERYPAVQSQPSVLVELTEMDVLIQVNGGSLLGEDGRASRQTAEALVRAGMAHIVATDAHRRDKRRPLLSAALHRVATLTDDLQAMQTQINAAAVLQGRSVSVPDPQVDALQTRSWFRLPSLRS